MGRCRIFDQARFHRIGECGLLQNVLRRAETRQVAKSSDLPRAAANPQQNEIFGLVGLELVEYVFRDHHAFIFADNGRSPIAKGESRLALQHDECMILAAMGMQRILVATGVDLDAGPKIFRRSQGIISRPLLE